MHRLGGAAQGDPALPGVTLSATALRRPCHMPLHSLLGRATRVMLPATPHSALPLLEFTNWAEQPKVKLALPRRGDAPCHRVALHCTPLVGACGPCWCHLSQLPRVVFPAATRQSAAPCPWRSYHSLQSQTKGFNSRSSIIEVAASVVVPGPGCRQGPWLCQSA